MTDMGLDAIGIVTEVEDAFGVELPDEAMEMKTVGELSDWISRQVANYESDAVWQIVQRIVAENLNIPLAEVRPESRWIEDLLVD